MSPKPTDKQSGNSGRDERGRFKKGHSNGFKPGASGNPSGRPKSITLSEALRNELAKAHPEGKDGETYAERIAGVLCNAAAGGSVLAAKEIADRTEGRPRQALDIDMSVMDWRALARSQGVDERDVIREAQRIIAESDTAGSHATNH